MSDAHASALATEEAGQQHPLGLYFKVWVALFILSTLSYMVDYLQFQGYVRWFLIVLFMWAKAVAIMTVFMHMRWERMSLIVALTVPPFAIGVFVMLMAIEGKYTNLTRMIVFGG